MSDNTANQRPALGGPSTIAEILQGGEPMGDLSRFAIEDLTSEEEDEFFMILEVPECLFRRFIRFQPADGGDQPPATFYTFFYTAGRDWLVRSGADWHVA